MRAPSQGPPRALPPAGTSKATTTAAQMQQQQQLQQQLQQQQGGGGSGSMLTQVQRGGGTAATAGTNSQLSNGVTYCKAVDELNPKQLTEYRALLRTSTNRSPVNPTKYLPLLDQPRTQRKTLILDVDETLVHSSYERTSKFDLHIPCCTDPARNQFTHVYVLFRPFLREFLEIACSLFEVVIFTASVEIYCRPLMQHLDPQKKCAVLWRDHCTNVNGLYVKDLSLLGRDLNNIAIIDNSPHAYLFQPRNAIPITSWFDNPDDHELRDLVELMHSLSRSRTVYEVLDVFNSSREPTY
jgi:Dullard-like phosphatase family protein